MAAIAAGGKYRVVVWCTRGNQASNNVLIFEAQNLVGANLQEQEAANDISTILSQSYKAMISEDASYRGLSFQRIDISPALVALYATTGQGPGTPGNGVVLPKQVCGIIAKKSGFAGRKYNGRVFLPFPSEAANDPEEGRPNNGYLSVLSTLCDNFNNGITATDGTNSARFDLGLWNKAQPFVFYRTAACAPRPFWATQRRRGDYGPENASPI